MTEITLQERWEYVPKWLGNDKRPSPVKARLRLLTSKERASVVHMDYNISRMVFDEPAAMVGVEGLEGLRVNGRDILTGPDILSAPGLDGLMHELAAELLQHSTVTEDALKNS